MVSFSTYPGQSIASSTQHAPLTQERLGVPDFELYGDEVLSLYLSIARSRNVQYVPPEWQAPLSPLEINDRYGLSDRWLISAVVFVEL